MSKSTKSSELFPARLRLAREKRGLSQGDMAIRAGLQPSAISHFETGTRKPSFDNLRKLADALEVTTDYLLGRVTEFQAMAGADQLHRDFDRLSIQDREFAEQILQLFAGRAEDKSREAGE
ncbi:MAG: helix-turn-helix transcriptional regulator [Bacteroidota bacterium]|jgi:transcriptional regulator with XRE-family HTH domain